MKNKAPRIICPKCGKEGILRSQYMRCGKKNCKCMLGRLHGPYPFVEHHQGYDKRRHHSTWHRCFLSKKALQERHWRRIIGLLSSRNPTATSAFPLLAMHAKEAIGRALRKLLCGLTTKPFKLILFANLCCFQHLLCAWTSSAPQSETTSSTCGVAPETATTG